MNNIVQINGLTPVKQDIIKTLLYFEVFDYPLNEEEIFRFSKYSFSDISIILNEMLTDNLIKKINGFYGINIDLKTVNRRIDGNNRASKILKKAFKISNFIAKFPFVRAVFISGSLSKGYFEKNDDIDYFIITSKNRVWIARTLLILYKKIFLLNNKKYFCVNYFMSEDNLEIPEKNRFTATECITLIPVIGKNSFKKLLDENFWIYSFFPNFEPELKPEIIKQNNFKAISEKLLNGKTGDFLERTFMKITKKHQQKKFQKKLNKKEFRLAFKGNKNTSKHHPQNHQIKTLDLLNKKIKEFNDKFGFSIPFEEV